ncbi:protein DEHYDRATION-INDUCED 19 homolog 3 isoform X2 [Amborella trichopoda]|uniref:protein DEHYDRATION-INDUCED 19 homolog 3 isoform X2 n=1 Tax=Amborella trichopoda TaxID=13333 RepID=UPI0009BDB153|nr:protein DEHYDRATION-INDUCED 19 homolog 3 isoform X2 [Amborella trichopoda]|eukprot:XP_020529783.1 protein DEHYDRATION-INDUCED 19 homolog 3 isoform X2 [Amborella trichopoda]
MEADSWTGRFSASKRHQTSIQTRSDLHLSFDDTDGEDEVRAEFPCPFCSEVFDIVSLCCHIDDKHSMEARNARRRRFRRGSMQSHSTLSFLSKELHEGHLQSLLGGSTCTIAPSNTAADPLLSSFIYNFPMSCTTTKSEPQVQVEGSSSNTSAEENVESVEAALPDEEQQEKARRCEFVRELLLSTILDDDDAL